MNSTDSTTAKERAAQMAAYVGAQFSRTEEHPTEGLVPARELRATPSSGSPEFREISTPLPPD